MLNLCWFLFPNRYLIRHSENFHKRSSNSRYVLKPRVEREGVGLDPVAVVMGGSGRIESGSREK